MCINSVDMLCCFNVQICMPELVIEIQNIIQNSFYCLGGLRYTLCRFAKVNHDTTINIIIVTGLLALNFACNYRNISKMADRSRPVNTRMHYVVFKVTSTGCLKLYLNP